MTLQNNDYSKFRTFAKPVAGFVAIALVAGTSFSLSPAATAQDASEEDDVEYEWDAEDGKHVEEWYDPSDWFNQDDVTDYEFDSWDYDGYTGTYSSFDYDAYFDGYYDGYYDDDFGYDNWDAAWDPGYSQYYTSGYYDGYYDAQTGYNFDAYYYVFDEDGSDSGLASDRERSGDMNRKRGDRQSGSASASNKQQDKTADKADDLMAVKQRVRGTVTKIVLRGRESVRGEMHTVGELGFANGTSLNVDFGPFVNAKNLTIDRGDVITIVGERVNRDGQTMMRANRLTDAGVVYRFAGPDRDKLRKEMESGDSKSWGDDDKPKPKDKTSGSGSGN